MASYESVVLIKQEVFVYKIPPRSSNRGYRYDFHNLHENFSYLFTSTKHKYQKKYSLWLFSIAF